MKHLFCDCKTDEEKANFFLSGRAVETGIIAPAISNDVAMAYHRCAEFKKEIDALRAKIAEMEKQGPVAHVWRCDNGHVHGSCESELLMGQQLYALPGAQPASSVPELLESLRCACNYIDKLGGVSQQYRAVLAASPKPEGE